LVDDVYASMLKEVHARLTLPTSMVYLSQASFLTAGSH
jgi:hypothetical protein